MKNVNGDKIKLIRDFFLDILFPKKCLGCGKEGKYICERCVNFLGESSLICPVCGKESFNGQRHNDCSSENELDGLVNIWEHEGLVKAVISSINNQNLRDIIPEFVDLSFKTMTNDKERFSSFFVYLFSSKPLITFVPKNQSELIAGEIGRITGLKLISPFKKGDEIKGKKLVLIDDVWTRRGEKMKKHCAILKKAGAEKIWGFTLSREV